MRHFGCLERRDGDHFGHMNTPDAHSVCRNNLIRRPSDWAGLCWLLFVGLIVLMICLPFMQSLFRLGDEGILLHGAERLLRGQRPYIDFFEMLPPGGFVIMTVWFGITGISIWSAR